MNLRRLQRVSTLACTALLLLPTAMLTSGCNPPSSPPTPTPSPEPGNIQNLEELQKLYRENDIPTSAEVGQPNPSILENTTSFGATERDAGYALVCAAVGNYTPAQVAAYLEAWDPAPEDIEGFLLSLTPAQRSVIDGLLTPTYINAVCANLSTADADAVQWFAEYLRGRHLLPY